MFWGLLCVAIWLFVWYLIAKEFYKIAVMKGHDDKKYLWWTFWLEIVGMLMVIALPDRAESTSVSKSFKDELPEL